MKKTDRDRTIATLRAKANARAVLRRVVDCIGECDTLSDCAWLHWLEEHGLCTRTFRGELHIGRATELGAQVLRHITENPIPAPRPPAARRPAKPRRPTS